MFFFLFCLMMEGSGAGAVPVTNGSGIPKTCGSCRSGSATLLFTLMDTVIEEQERDGLQLQTHFYPCYLEHKRIEERMERITHQMFRFLQCCAFGSRIRCLFWSWIRDRFFRISDPGSQPHIFESLMTNFWVKSSIFLCKLAQIYFFSISKL